MVGTYGTKNYRAVAPAIGIARDGFGLIEFQRRGDLWRHPELRGQPTLPEWSRNYLEGISGGRPPGAVLKQPDLAKR